MRSSLSSTSSHIPSLSLRPPPTILPSPRLILYLPSFLFSRPPEPNTCVSSEFQGKKGGQDAVAGSLSRVPSRWV